jgi:UDP-N-acetyl-D-mannosaminuronic acid dehydrogenase
VRIVVIGGGGHVGLPLGIALAQASDQLQVVVQDINPTAVTLINQGKVPFLERGAEEALRRVIGKNLTATTERNALREADVLVVVIGTPVDEYLNPTYRVFETFMEESRPYFRDGQTLILRSTVYPGTSAKIRDYLERHGIKAHVGYCPERIAEGMAMEELRSLPQIVSGFDEHAVATARQVFGTLTPDIVELDPAEAEMAKLFTNSWRYIQFATANQYYMLAQAAGLDFYRIHNAITYKYPRAQGFPKAGFAAGPCLFKDTMMLSSFSGNQYFLGHAAMLVNEGLPQFVVERLKQQRELKSQTVGILGMAFKAESDDIRASLSFKLKKLLNFEASQVLCTDEFVKGPDILPLQEVVDRSDVLILAAPHRAYRELRTTKPVVDVWNLLPPSGQPGAAR